MTTIAKKKTVTSPKILGAAKEQRRAAAAARDAEMAKRGFVSITEGARLAKVARGNVYAWAASGAVRKETWGVGKGSVYVLLSDLMLKVPAAFKGKP